MNLQQLEQDELAQLRQKLEKYFTLSELRTLLFDLGVDYERIPHRSEKEEVTREIVAYFARRNRVSELIQMCKRLRPHVDWGTWRLPDSVPLLGSIGAGRVDFRPPEEWATAEEWIRIAPDLPYRVDELFALRVQGNSMDKAHVVDGDTIIVRYQPTVENGEIAAVWLKGDDISTLKRLYREYFPTISFPAYKFQSTSRFTRQACNYVRTRRPRYGIFLWRWAVRHFIYWWTTSCT